MKTLFYIPNIIGYLRILLLVYAFYNMEINYKKSIFYYFISFVMDALDGFLARLFNQCSKFGQILDMLTDRTANIVLGAFLFKFTNNYFYLIYIVVDINSHLIQLITSFIINKSHKEISNYYILKIYYTNKYFMLFFCLFSEIFMLSEYAINLNKTFSSKILFLNKIAKIGFIGKFTLNVIQLIDSIQIFIKNEEKSKIN